MISRAALGIFILTGAAVGFYNVAMSVARGRPLDLPELQRREAA